ncbi:MAG: hypothetical protein M3O82_05175 [Verrucomicrobiota bacterium]|nr:hypothetical protein [Verrucomicrobiota bacterium]
MFKHSFFLIALGFSTSFIFAQADKQLPDLDSARVSISYAELKSLWQAAQHEKDSATKKPPVTATLLAARYEITLHGEQAAGVLALDVQSLTDGWTVVPLVDAGMQIDSIEPADAQISLAENHYALVTNRAGKSTVKFKFTAKLAGFADLRNIALPNPHALVNTLAVAGLPVDGMARVHDAVELSSGKESATFRLPAQDRFELEILPAKAIAPPVPSRWMAESQALVRFDEGALHNTAHIQARAESGSGMEMDLQLPASARVTKVAGEDIADWNAQNASGETRTLRIRWTTRDELQRQVDVEYEIPESLTAAEWKLFAPRADENRSAVYAVVADEGMQLDAPPANRRVPRWLAEHATGQNVAIVEDEAHLAVKTLPVVEPAQAFVERATSRMRVVVDGSLLNEISYAIHSENPIAWRLQLPQGSELIACRINGKKTNPINAGENTIQVALPAPGGRQTSEVELSYTSRTPAFKPVSGQLALELPETALLIHTLNWELRIPAAYELTALEGNVETSPGRGTAEGVIQLHKELCKGEAPAAQIFYEKTQTK